MCSHRHNMNETLFTGDIVTDYLPIFRIATGCYRLIGLDLATVDVNV